MPYIKQAQRERFDPIIDTLANEILEVSSREAEDHVTDGTFNYCVTRLIQKVFGKINYHQVVRIAGNLECIKLEFYRRAAAPYENKKVKENGDVYEHIEGGQLPQAPPS